MEAKTLTEENRFTWLGKQIPNILTVIRIVLVPVFIYLFVVATNGYNYSQLGNYYYHQLAALIVFCVAAYTDYLDGLLARRWNLVSNFGKLVDPIADKTLMMSSFILLSWYFWLYWWFTCVVILREFLVTFMRFVLLRGGKVLPASQGGKLKTLLQCSLVFLLLLQPLVQHYSFTLFYVWTEILVLVAAFVVTIVSGFAYFLDSWVDLRDIMHQFLQDGIRKTAVDLVAASEQKSELGKIDFEGRAVAPDILEENEPMVSVKDIPTITESLALDNTSVLDLVEGNNLENDKADREEEKKLLTPFWKPLQSVVPGFTDPVSKGEVTQGQGEGQRLKAEGVLDSAELGYQPENTILSAPLQVSAPVAAKKYPPRRKRNL